ncbi:hypothetical protein CHINAEXTREME_18115 [Halobiforma lacisalsi AJ5]|uniref:NAD(P)-binding domain-containing protein n=1 Tax=Natronobacterium lacisalsi AJ5 TaxID=358396 RepID=A0A1P8LUX7_NATLA|nr:hypothetical protein CHINAEXTREME_18115 [Halobiforma lacisalsi AJ5]
MTRTVLVTGATGTVGRHVVGALADRPDDVRVGVRDPEAAQSTLPDAATADVVEFDFEKPETWGPTLPTRCSGLRFSCKTSSKCTGPTSSNTTRYSSPPATEKRVSSTHGTSEKSRRSY